MMQDEKHVILVVDDDPDIRYALKVVLEGNGYVVAEAATAEDGLRVYKKSQPDLIILDLMMEEVDAGVAFVKELKVLGNEAPIYMLSSVGDNLHMSTDYTELGLAGVFQKPLDNNTLLSILATKLK
jgi:two-component system nitrogen regulation response regulator NtrX